jgi:hypothetical protein
MVTLAGDTFMVAFTILLGASNFLFVCLKYYYLRFLISCASDWRLFAYYTFRQLRVMAEWSGPNLHKSFRLLLLHEWNFLFIMGAMLMLVEL